MKNEHGYINNIEKLSLENEYFRHVLYTTTQMQLVLMSLAAGEDIGKEVHEGHTQFIRVEDGEGTMYLDGEEFPVSDGFAIVVPPGVEHNLTNTGNTALRLYTLYALPEHKDGVIHETKDIAEERHPEEGFNGVLSYDA